jgi:hypothetical protein
MLRPIFSLLGVCILCASQVSRADDSPRPAPEELESQAEALPPAEKLPVPENFAPVLAKPITESQQPAASDAKSIDPRYRWHEQRWWFAMPDGRWVWWDNFKWQPFEQPAAATPAIRGPGQAKIPTWVGPAPSYGPPAYPGGPRYRGEPYASYHGRPVRIKSAWANGFLEASVANSWGNSSGLGSGYVSGGARNGYPGLGGFGGFYLSPLDAGFRGTAQFDGFGY